MNGIGPDANSSIHSFGAVADFCDSSSPVHGICTSTPAWRHRHCEESGVLSLLPWKMASAFNQARLSLPKTSDSPAIFSLLPLLPPPSRKTSPLEIWAQPMNILIHH